MGGTRAIFVLYLAVVAAGIAGAIVIGLARSDDDPAAGETVARFATALDERDGRAACVELSADAREALESEEASECEEAILDVDLTLGEVSAVEVADSAATVELSEGGSVYLDDTSEGWRISAVGCEPRPDEPDDCDVE
jgi:hypothetical protein